MLFSVHSARVAEFMVWIEDATFTLPFILTLAM
jgi:hypothetical protein